MVVQPPEPTNEHRDEIPIICYCFFMHFIFVQSGIASSLPCLVSYLLPAVHARDGVGWGVQSFACSSSLLSMPTHNKPTNYLQFPLLTLSMKQKTLARQSQSTFSSSSIIQFHIILQLVVISYPNVLLFTACKTQFYFIS